MQSIRLMHFLSEFAAVISIIQNGGGRGLVKTYCLYIINGYDLKSIKQLYRILTSRKSDIKEYCKLYEKEAARKCWDLFEKCIFKGMDRTSAELYELGRLCDPHESSKLKKQIFKSIIVRKLYNYNDLMSLCFSAYRE